MFSMYARAAAPALAVLLFSVPAWAGAAPRTLSRAVGYTDVPGERVPQLLGEPIDRIGLYAWRGDELAPIPFQIDERDANGRWILPQGEEPDASDDGGKLDANDLVLIENAAAGDRRGLENYRVRFKQEIRKAAEIEVRHPKDGTRAWVYAFSFAEPPTLSPERRVRQTGGTGSIEGVTYKLTYDKDFPVSWSELHFKNADLTTWSPNLIDRIKVRVYAKLFWGLADIERTEEEFHVEVPAYKEGPLRVIRRQLNSVEMILNLKSPSVEFEVVFYPDALVMPIKVELPFRPDGFFSDLQVVGGTDMRDMKGWKFFTSLDPTPVSVDGKMSEAEENMKTGDCDWFVFYSGSRAFVQKITMQGAFKVTRQVEWRDGMEDLTPPEYVEGSLPFFGYRMKGWEKLDAGVYTMSMNTYNVPDYAPGKEKEYLALLDTPLAVSSAEVDLSAAALAIAEAAPAPPPAAPNGTPALTGGAQ